MCACVCVCMTCGLSTYILSSCLASWVDTDWSGGFVVEGYTAWHAQTGRCRCRCREPVRSAGDRTTATYPRGPVPYRALFRRFRSLSPSLSFLVFFLLALASQRRLFIYHQASKQVHHPLGSTRLCGRKTPPCRECRSRASPLLCFSRLPTPRVDKRARRGGRGGFALPTLFFVHPG